jgi:CRISPR/Cas system-associated protein Cas5 (RAMP superfamily)
MNTYKEAFDTIEAKLDETDVLMQLAEEAAELSKAALKIARVLRGRNYTPVTIVEAEAALIEEIADVNIAVDVALRKRKLPYDRVAEIEDEKILRWAKRLKEASR